MKLIITRRAAFLWCSLLFITAAFAQNTWQPLGPDDFNQPYTGGAQFTSVAIHPITGDAYLAYDPTGPVDNPTVRKFNNETGHWEDVGEAFSTSTAANISLAFTSDGTLYVGYSDYGNDTKATVKEFIAGTGEWQLVGVPFSSGTAGNTSLVVGPDDILYMNYKDTALNNKAVVKKFNGTAWEAVGVAGFSQFSTVYNSIDIAADGTIYVAFASWYSGQLKATVMKYAGTAWEIVGTEAFTSGGTAGVQIKVNPVTNVPYIGYRDSENGNAYKLKKFNGTSWEHIGAPGFGLESVPGIYFAFSSSGVPYLAYASNYNLADTTAVIKYNGTNWEVVGQLWFSIGDVVYQQLVLDGETPYLAYVELTNASKPTLMKYDGTAWVCQGGTMGFSEESTVSDSTPPNTNELVISEDGTIYMGYIEESNGSKITVKKYNTAETGWETVGNSSFSTAAESIGIAAYQDMLYVCYTQNNYPYKATAMKYNGTAWQTLGTPQFTPGGAYNTAIAVSPDGTPYVLYSDETNNDKASVMKFNGTAWETVGAEGFSSGGITDPVIMVAANGTPYVTYTAGQGEVMKFNGTAWEAIGGAFSESQASWPDIHIGPDGFLYTAYSDFNNYGKAVVKKFTGTEWETIGNFSDEAVSYTTLATKPDGQLFLSYHDNDNSGKATLVRYNGINWVPVGVQGLSAAYALDPEMCITPDGQYAVVGYSSPCLYARSFDITCFTTAPVAAAQQFCNAATVAGLEAEGENIRWYSVEHFGDPLAADVPLVSGTYYVSQMQNDCEGPRATVAVVINTTPEPVAGAQTFCNSATVAALTAQGENLIWYAGEEDTEALTADATLADGTYYVSQSLNDCESIRVPVSVAITVVDLPQGEATQIVSTDTATIENLLVNGSAVQWYDAEGNLLPEGTQLTDGATYYATQTIEGCESAQLAVTVSVVLGSGGTDRVSFKYYPNPVADKLHIVSGSTITYVEIYTLQGQKVAVQQLNAPEGDIDMRNLADSVYFVYAYSEDAVKRLTIIKGR
jgi:Secretion system C-terminal sorting domain